MNTDQLQLFSVIKDIFTIFFTGFATVLSFKTYKRVKKTLLQPMKSEVIKIQTDLFIKLLSFLYNDLLEKESRIYEEIIFLNTYSYLISCGYKFSNQEELVKIIQDNTKTSLIFPNNDGVCDAIELIQTVDDTEDDDAKDVKEAKNKRRTDLNNGLVNMEIFKLGNGYLEIDDVLNSYINNPIMPQIIVDNLVAINRTIHDNITISLYETIKDYIMEFSKNNYKKIIIPGIYNNFNRNKESVSDICDTIRVEIRKYLRVDEEWM